MPSSLLENLLSRVVLLGVSCRPVRSVTQSDLSFMPNAHAWTDVTTEEMKAFIGITIPMEIIQLS